MIIKLIIGIGNYIKKYFNTRHNVGIWFINILSKIKNKNLVYDKNINGFISKINLKNSNIILFIPNSFINTSGICIKNILNYFNIKNEEIIIVHDEIYFDTGIFEIKFGGSSEGHNGIKNIIYNIKTDKFYRLKIGIGKITSKKNISDFVLSKPSYKEKNNIIYSIHKSIIELNNNI